MFSFQFVFANQVALVKSVSKAVTSPQGVAVISRYLGITLPQVKSYSNEDIAMKLMARSDFDLKEFNDSLKSLDKKVDMQKKKSVLDFLGSSMEALTLEDGIGVAVKNGKLSTSKASLLQRTAVGIKDRFNVSTFGSGINSCFKDFNSNGVNNIASIVIAARSANSLKEVFGKMLQKTQLVFTEGKIAARNRLCSLAGINSECKIFGELVLQNCK